MENIITGSGYVYEYSYDNVGRNTEIKTDYGTIEFGYNNLDYVAKIKDANGNITKKSYDKMGNLIRVDTPNGIVKDDNTIILPFNGDYLELHK